MPHLRDIPLAYLEIVMVGTRFPENVGMAVRACARSEERRVGKECAA